MLLEANPRNISASKISRYTVCFNFMIHGTYISCQLKRLHFQKNRRSIITVSQLSVHLALVVVCRFCNTMGYGMHGGLSCDDDFNISFLPDRSISESLLPTQQFSPPKDTEQ